MKKLIITAIALVLLIPLLVFAVDFIRFPEWYLPTWKTALERDIKAGNEQAIELYENTYLANGRILFE